MSCACPGVCTRADDHGLAKGHCACIHEPDGGIEPRVTAPDARQSDELREALVEESARHRSIMERAPHGPFELYCACGWNGGRYDHGWGADGTHAAWRLHQADALLPVVTAWAETQARARAAARLRAAVTDTTGGKK